VYESSNAILSLVTLATFLLDGDERGVLRLHVRAGRRLVHAIGKRKKLLNVVFAM
jgi:hypothetical protein